MVCPLIPPACAGPQITVSCGPVLLLAGIATIGAALGAENRSEPFFTPDGREIAHGGRRGSAEDYLAGKGWTPEEVDDAINNPEEVYDNERRQGRTGQRTRTYVDQNGNWVVVNEDGDVIQVNEQGNSRQPRPRESEESRRRREEDERHERRRND